MVQYYEPKADDPNVDPPRPGSFKMALFLSRNPRQIDFTNTTDGAPAPFLDDGGKIENGMLTKPGGNRQLCIRSARRAREDKGFIGLPLFVAFDRVAPAFQGDVLTTDAGGLIILGTDEHKVLIEESLKVRNKNIKDARSLANPTLDKLKIDNRDPTTRLVEALQKLSGGAPAVDTNAEVAALKAQLDSALKENADLKAAPPVEASAKPDDPEVKVVKTEDVDKTKTDKKDKNKSR